MKSIIASLVTLGLALVVVSAVVQKGRGEDTSNVKATFEERYQAWKEYISTPGVRFSSSSGAYIECTEFERIVALGPAALPCIIAKIQEDRENSGAMCAAIARIAGKKFAPGEDPVEWWTTGEAETRRRFDELFGKWQDLKTGKETLLWTNETVYNAPAYELYTKRRNMTEAGQVYQAIHDLGIAVLPCIVETLKQGKYDLLDMAVELTNKEAPVQPERLPVPAEWKAERFLSWWEENKERWTIPWPEE